MAKPRPIQIKALCSLLEKLWQRYPDLRFGQVVAIVSARAGIDNDLFYVGDKEVFNQIRAEISKCR